MSRDPVIGQSKSCDRRRRRVREWPRTTVTAVAVVARAMEEPVQVVPVVVVWPQ